MSYWVSGTQKDYEVPDEGLHDGVLVDVVDLGIQDTGFGPKQMVALCWQLDIVSVKSGKRFVVKQRYNASIHPKSKLGQHLATWRGRAFTDEERRKFDIEKLLAVNAQVQVVHNVSKQGGTFANINAILPPIKNPTTKKPWWDRLLPLEYEREKDRVEAHQDVSSHDTHDPFAGANGDPEPPALEYDDDVPF